MNAIPAADPAAEGGDKAAASAQADCTPTLADRRFFCSWSGGKDAYLAFARAVAAGGRPEALVCMLHELSLIHISEPTRPY